MKMMTNDEIIQFLQSIEDDSVIEYSWLTDEQWTRVSYDDDGFDFSKKAYRIKREPYKIYAIFNDGQVINTFHRDDYYRAKAYSDKYNFELVTLSEQS